MEFKSTIHAFIQAKLEIQTLNNNTATAKFKYSNLELVLAEIKRVIKDKGLTIISYQHIENNNVESIRINSKNSEYTTHTSFGTGKFKIGSIWDNEILEWEIPAVYESSSSTHDATYSANSICYRYFWLRAFDIPTTDEDKSRKQTDKILEIKEDKLQDDKGNNIWEPSLKQLNLFRVLFSKNELLKNNTTNEMKEMELNSVKEFLIIKGKEYLNNIIKEYGNK